VSANVREFWARLDCEQTVLQLLEKCSSFNDQMHELFQPSELCSASAVVPLLLRTGLATNLLNKAVLIQRVLGGPEPVVSHAQLLARVLPELAGLYATAAQRAKGSVLDAWRLLTKRSHVVTLDGVSLPVQPELRERVQAVCGENVLATPGALDRVRLRRAVEREQSAVKLVAEVLKQM